MKVAVLGSGSRGNAILVSTDDTCLLVDAGFSARDLARRMGVLGVDPDALDGIVISHDHGDHTRGMGVFARRHGTPLYLTSGTRAACGKLLRGEERIVEYEAAHPFQIGDLTVEPFVTVHDAADPVGLAISHPSTRMRMGVATDLGRPTAGIRHALSGCDLLILEANHDEVLLQEAPYPWSVKSRIRSSHGHLSNRAAAQFATELYHTGLKAVVLAHLSAESNDPDLALQTVGRALNAAGFAGHLVVAPQDDPLPFMDLVAMGREQDPPQLSFL